MSSTKALMMMMMPSAVVTCSRPAVACPPRIALEVK
jgi:hypothetical protein